MTENPTIPSTPGPSQPPSLANSTTTPEDAADTSGEIDCICEISDDDGFTICCDKCDTWQHLVCVQLNKDNVPGTYYCPKCSPRTLDVQGAKDIQRHRREEEQAKRSHKKKRSTGTSHKRKELANGTNGITPGKISSSTEKTGVQGPGKLVSPKEMQQPSRKRGHRVSAQPNSNAGVNSSASHHSILTNVPNTNIPLDPPSARNGETESDTDPEKPRYLREGFTDLGSSPNKYTGADVQRFLHSLVMPASDPNMTRLLERCIYLNRQELASLGLPKASSQVLPETSKSNIEHSKRRLLLGADCFQGDLITIYKGEVGFQDSYRKDRANQYSSWGHPKPYVLFHPNLPIYVDARRYGSEARFVRRSCRPNLALQTIVVDHSEMCFGLFANQPLKPGAELTVGWDWNGALESRQFVKEGFDVYRLSSEHLRELAVWIQQLTHKMGDCACLGGKECLVNQIRKMTDGETVTGKTPNGNGSSRKQRRTNASTESAVGSQRPSPDCQSVPLKKEEDEEGRSVSPPVSRSKPRSRDLTPSMLQDVAVEKGEMTGREARKFKDVLSRIEKQQQEEQLPQVAKRRKRNSTVSLTPGASSLHSPGIDMKDWIKVADSSKRNKLSNPRSLYSPPATGTGPNHGFAEYSVTDAGVGRRASESPVSSDERRTRRTASYSPVGQLNQGSDTLKRPSKTVVRPVQAQYEDKAVQTDPVGEEIPWWSPAAVKAPPRPPRLPLRKRLMQSLLRDREEAAATVLEDKKRKIDAASEDPEDTLSPKVPKLFNSGSARGTTISPFPDAKGSLDVPLPTATLTTLDTNSLSSRALITSDMSVTMVDASVIKSRLSPRPPGPALADLFSADSDKPLSTQHIPTQEKQSSEKTQANLPQDKPRVNGYKNPSLQVQLLPGPGIVNGPSTPALQSSLPSAPNSASVQPPLIIYSNCVNPSVSALNSSMVNPSPTRTKKMSLEDYGKRKHRADPVEKSDEKLSVKATNEGPTTATNLSKTPMVPLMQEPTSIAGSIPGTLSVVTAPPPPVINSSKLATEPVRIPSTPKDQRTTSLSSSVR
ncbi:hypothetical protein C7212DRAFT_346656 [Tuber magnatum]|uniref:SET domain-containing protein n=1 Tax=Tuber magnatum TaxID=42249 RepID=A0A317SHS2_9PEZI|nr:hypothetical protein C7212DRAFT_346656 [Tuber magnatum]